MSLLFLLVLIVQEVAVLYCAYRIAFGPLREPALTLSSVSGVPVPEFARVRVLPPPGNACHKHARMARGSVSPWAHKHHCRKERIRSLMTASAKA